MIDVEPHDLDPDRLILAARVRMLKRSLEAVRDSLKTVEKQRKVMRDLLPGVAATTDEKLGKIDDVANRIWRLVQGSGFAKALLTDTIEIKGHTSAIRVELTDMGVGPRHFGMIGEESPQAVALQEEFLEEVDSKIADVTRLQGRISAARTGAEEQSLWTEERTAFEDSQHLFAEYVDLLTGLAMRDSGFDNGISDIADALIRKRISGRYSLTILGHKPREQVAKAKFLHLGFPEWTPWALPLAAFDIGRLELGRGDLPKFVADKVAAGFDRVELEKCLADAIATYLVGPAYLWATMVIQLDPGSRPADRRVATRRFTAMQTVLRSMDTDVTETTFGQLADQLGQAWSAAISEAGDAQGPAESAESDEVGGLPLDPVEQTLAQRRIAALADVVRTLGTPPTQTPFAAASAALEAAWNQATAELEMDRTAPAGGGAAKPEISAAEVESWINDNKLSNHKHRAMSELEWADVVDLADELRRIVEDKREREPTPDDGLDAVDADQPQVDAPNDLRLVLNAGWLARMKMELDRSEDDRPLELLGDLVANILGQIASSQDSGEGSPTGNRAVVTASRRR